VLDIKSNNLSMSQASNNLAGRLFPPANSSISSSIFIGDLSFFCTEIELALAFESFGNVVGLHIKRGRMGDSLLHGFVEYDNESSARLAMQRMNGQKLMGRKIRVNWTNSMTSMTKDLHRSTQVHVTFTATNVSMVYFYFFGDIFAKFPSLPVVAFSFSLILTNRFPLLLPKNF
jgi:RNA recognition motif-containing protein